MPDATRPGWTVLLVDDEPLVLDAGRTSLVRAGFRVLTAKTVAEAEIICRDHAGPIDLLVMDIILEKGHGFDAFPYLCRVRPELNVLYITGCPPHLMDDGVGVHAPILFKPYTPDELVEAVTEIIRYHHTSTQAT